MTKPNRNPEASPIAAEGEEELRQLRAECDRLDLQYELTDDADRLRERLNTTEAMVLRGRG